MARPGILLSSFILVALIGIAGIIGVLAAGDGETVEPRIVEALPSDSDEEAFPAEVLPHRPDAEQPAGRSSLPIGDALEFPRVAVDRSIPWTLVLLPDDELRKVVPASAEKKMVVQGTLPPTDAIQAKNITMVMRYGEGSRLGEWADPATLVDFAASSVDYSIDSGSGSHDIAVDLAAVEELLAELLPAPAVPASMTAPVAPASLKQVLPELVWGAPLPPVPPAAAAPPTQTACAGPFGARI